MLQVKQELGQGQAAKGGPTEDSQGVERNMVGTGSSVYPDCCWLQFSCLSRGEQLGKRTRCFTLWLHMAPWCSFAGYLLSHQKARWTDTHWWAGTFTTCKQQEDRVVTQIQTAKKPGPWPLPQAVFPRLPRLKNCPVPIKGWASLPVLRVGRPHPTYLPCCSSTGATAFWLWIVIQTTETGVCFMVLSGQLPESNVLQWAPPAREPFRTPDFFLHKFEKF